MSKQTGTRTRKETRPESVFDTNGSVCSPKSSGHKNQTLIRNFFVVASRNKTSQSVAVVRQSTSKPSSAGATTVSQSPSAPAPSTLSPTGTSRSPCHRVRVNRRSTGTNHSKDPTRQIPANECMSLSQGLSQGKRRRTTPASYEQLYIDLGQRNFAETTICSVCGMLAVHGLEADIQRHKAVCQAHTLGVSFPHELPVSTTATNRHTCSSTIDGNRNTPKQSCAVRIRETFTLPYTASTDSTSKATTNGRSSLRRTKPLHERKSRQKAVIIEIRPTDSPTMLHKLTQVRAIVDQELGFVEAESRSKTMVNLPLTSFMCIVQKRVVGMVLVEPITVAYRLLPSSVKPRQDSSNKGDTGTVSTKHKIAHGIHLDWQASFAWERATEPCAAVLGIYQLWVHDKHRHCGIASALVDAARRHFVFGYHTVPLNRMAFSSPTESGVRFAIQYHESHKNGLLPFNELEVLVYDCK